MEKRLLTLDAMRGLAAIAVVLFHIQLTDKPLVESGYLAVDFFFLLSGFVVARAYESRLRQRLGTLEFSVLRLIRLYPLFLVGLVLGLLQQVSLIMLHRPHHEAPAQLAGNFLFELFMLPSPLSADTFPINGPGWSLCFEMAVNIMFAAVFVRMRTAALALICLASGGYLAYSALSAGTIFLGYSWDYFGTGIARTLFSFLLGVMMSRVKRKATPISATLPLWLGVLLLGVLVMPDLGNYKLMFEFASVVLLFPLLVWLGTSYNPPGAFTHGANWLGKISYAVYAVHFPLLGLQFVARKLGLPDPVMVVAVLAIIVAVAWLLDKFYDEPVRAWLTNTVAARRGRRTLEPA